MQFKIIKKYVESGTNYAKKSFVLLTPGVYLKKLLNYQFTHTFYKLDHCINVAITFLCCEKSEFTPKLVSILENFFAIIYTKISV